MSLYDLLWWFNGIYCMHCNSKNTSLVKKDKLSLHLCGDCHKEFTVFTGTPFQRTKLNEEQWGIILKELTSETKPFLLAKKVGIHHWSMSKIMTKIWKHMRRGLPLPPEESIKPFRKYIKKLAKFFELTGAYREALGVMLAFLYYTKDLEAICRVAGISPDFTNKCLDNIKKSWEPGKEFIDCGKNYQDYEDFGEVSVVTSLYVLCLLGEITRDPTTGMFSCSSPQPPSQPLQQEAL